MPPSDPPEPDSGLHPTYSAVFVDLETTGLTPFPMTAYMDARIALAYLMQHEITEMGWVRVVDGVVQDEGRVYVRARHLETAEAQVARLIYERILRDELARRARADTAVAVAASVAPVDDTRTRCVLAEAQAAELRQCLLHALPLIDASPSFTADEKSRCRTLAMYSGGASLARLTALTDLAGAAREATSVLSGALEDLDAVEGLARVTS